VTGVSSGLGSRRHASLAAHGADGVGAARDWPRPKPRPRRCEQMPGKGRWRPELIELDLAEPLKSVRACADRLLAKGDPLDIVIGQRRRNGDSVRAHPPMASRCSSGTNHLGHFVLVNRSRPSFARRPVDQSLLIGSPLFQRDLADQLQRRSTSRSSPTGDQRPQTYFPVASTNDTETPACAAVACTRGSSTPSLLGT